MCLSAQRWLQHTWINRCTQEWSDWQQMLVFSQTVKASRWMVAERASDCLNHLACFLLQNVKTKGWGGYHGSIKTTKLDFFCIFWWRNNDVHFMKVFHHSFYTVDVNTECFELQQMKESDLFCFSVLEPSYGNLPQNLKKWSAFFFYVVKACYVFAL